MALINPELWISYKQCVKHNPKWTYENFHKKHCLMCLEDAVNKLNMEHVSKLFPGNKTAENNQAK